MPRGQRAGDPLTVPEPTIYDPEPRAPIHLTMKKIIVIAKSENEQRPLCTPLTEGPENFELFCATNSRQAIDIVEEHDAEAIIYDLASFPQSQHDDLGRLSHYLPHIPCIAIVAANAEETDSASTANTCLRHPVAKEKLLEHLNTLLRLSTSGQVRGIPVHSLLQMLESDEKTCTLKVQSHGRSGMIFIKRGVVIGATTCNQENEDAIYAIISWEEPVVELRYFNGQRPQTITRPLLSLIMEGLRLKDEQESINEKQEAQQKPKLELKHFSTAGNRLSLDIGAKVKLEFDTLDTPLVSTMVGMLPDEWIVVTTPTPHAIAETAVQEESWIVLKYLHMGRLCLFRTQALKTIDKPYPLLFLDYPPVIHYHELRRAKRTSIFIPCTLHLQRGPELYGVMVDLSGLGCLCLVKSKGNTEIPIIDIESKLQLRCMLPGLKEDQELTAVVKNFRKSAAEIRIGLEFSGLQEYLREVIEKYVYSVETIIG